jgi:hypothetical protein
MKKITILVFVIILLSGCVRYSKYIVDRDEQKQNFLQCLAAIPKGPESTHYNDWDEVINSCNNIAESQATYCIKYCDETNYISAPIRKENDTETK